MTPVSERIVNFISNNHVMTLATSDASGPYCCSIFYVFDPGQCCFYFMSSSESKHIQQAIRQPLVAGTIVPGDTAVAKIQGIQFTGRCYQPDHIEMKEAKRKYLKHFPLALLFDSSVWAVEIDFIKMTDNTLGFGKKILWNRILTGQEV